MSTHDTARHAAALVAGTASSTARTLTWRVELDGLTAEVLATSAAQQGLTAEELAALILYQSAATRVGWPGQDGKGLRLAWRDWMSGRLPFDEPDA